MSLISMRDSWRRRNDKITSRVWYASCNATKRDTSFSRLDQALAGNDTWGPFLERPGNLTGPKYYFEIEVLRKVGCVLTSNEVHFVFLADNFTA